MRTYNFYTIGNNAIKENEMVLIGEYYMEKSVYNHIENHIKERILSDHRMAARQANKYWSDRYARIKARRKEQIKNTIMTTIILTGFFMMIAGMILHSLIL